MSRAGPAGGTATLSSYRVQKAFSINFRENKRLLAEIRLIESEHVRNIRLVKQGIKDTRMWLEKVRESSGKSPHGLRPDTEPGRKRVKEKKVAPPRSKTAAPDKLQVDGPPMKENDLSEDEELMKVSEEDPAPPAEPEEKDVKKPITVDKILAFRKARPWTEFHNAQTKIEERHRTNVMSQPAVMLYGVKSDVIHMHHEEYTSDGRRNRAVSANSDHSSLASLSVFQRRRTLRNMMAKKQTALENKREMIAIDNQRISSKVNKYLESLEEHMDITMPDLTQWKKEEARHEIPPATDVNVTSGELQTSSFPTELH